MPRIFNVPADRRRQHPKQTTDPPPLDLAPLDEPAHRPGGDPAELSSGLIQ